MLACLLKPSHRLAMKLFLSLLLLLFAVPAFAQNVKTPNVEKGLFELEEKGRYFIDSAAAKDDKKELEFNVSYGVTDRWKTKLEATVDEDKAGDLTYRRTKFENVLQLTSSKDGFFADTALYNDVSFSDRSDSSHDVTFGLLGRKDIGVTTNTANFYVKKDWGDTALNGTSIMYRWQTRYNLMKAFQPGFEILGDTKRRDAFRDQTLGIGPAAFGSIGLDAFGGDKNQKIGYDLTYAFGATPATADGTLKWKLKYAIQF